MEIGDVRLMGPTEIADYLGYTRQRTWNLVNRRDFPAPRWTLGGGRFSVWWADDVEDWARAHGLPATAEDPEGE